MRHESSMTKPYNKTQIDFILILLVTLWIKIQWSLMRNATVID